IAFSIEIAVSNAGYTLDGFLTFDNHIPGEYLFRNTLVLFAKLKDSGEWALRYVWSDENWSGGTKNKADLQGSTDKSIGLEQIAPDRYSVPIESEKGFKAELKIDLAEWS